MMQRTVGEVRAQVMAVTPAVRWGLHFRFFRDEVLAVLFKQTIEPSAMRHKGPENLSTADESNAEMMYESG